MYLNIGTGNNHHSAFGTNGKVVVLGVPILKHFRVPIYLFVIYIIYMNGYLKLFLLPTITADGCNFIYRFFFFFVNDIIFSYAMKKGALSYILIVELFCL